MPNKKAKKVGPGRAQPAFDYVILDETMQVLSQHPFPETEGQIGFRTTARAAAYHLFSVIYSDFCIILEEELLTDQQAFVQAKRFLKVKAKLVKIIEELNLD